MVSKRLLGMFLVAALCLVTGLALLPATLSLEQNLLVTTAPTGYQVVGTYRAPISFGKPVTWLVEIRDPGGSLSYVSYTTPPINLTERTLTYSKNVSLSVAEYTISSPHPYTNLSIPLPYGNVSGAVVLTNQSYARNGSDLVFSIPRLDGNATIDILTSYAYAASSPRRVVPTKHGPLLITASRSIVGEARYENRTIDLGIGRHRDASSVSVQLPEAIPEHYVVYGRIGNRTIDAGRPTQSELVFNLSADEAGNLSVRLPTNRTRILARTARDVSLEDQHGNASLSFSQNVSSFSLVDPTTVPDRPANFTGDLYRWTTGNLTGDSVDLIINRQHLPANLVVWKHDSVTGRWYRFPYIRLNSTAIKVTIFDGGLGDDDGVVNGRITDDIGLATTWWNGSWRYRQQITVNTSAASTANNISGYELKLSLNAANVPANWSWASDKNSLRFTWVNETSGSEQLTGHYTESYDATGHTATVWVRVPLLPGNTTNLGEGVGITTLLMYYDNPTASDTSNGSATFTAFDTFNGSAIPAQLRSTDQDTVAGTRFNVASGILNNTAGGTDTWTGSDQYGSVYLPNVTGDFQATVEVVSQGNSNVWAKAGIMARNNLTQSTVSTGYSFMTETPGNGYSYQSDANNNGYLDTNVNSGAANYPSFVRLTRIGNTFIGSYGTSLPAIDSTLTTVSSYASTSANPTMDVGMSVTSHAGTTLSEVHFDNFTVRHYLATVPTVTYGIETYRRALNITIDRPINASSFDRNTPFTMNGTLDCFRGTCPNASATFQYYATITPLTTHTDTLSSDFTGNSTNTTTSNNEIALQSTNGAPPWWNTAWPYRQNVTVSNPNAGTITNYTLQVTLNSSVVGAGFDWTRDENATRFVYYNASSGTSTVLGYTITSWNVAGQTATIDVLVPNALVGSSTIQLYYGNAAATSASTQSGGYLWYDGFNGASIDPSYFTTDSDGVAGTAFSESNGNLSITAAGADTWTGSDAYGSVWRKSIAGNVEIITNVTSETNTNAWSKAGIMVRNDMSAPGSSTGYAVMTVTPGNNYNFQYDSNDNGYLDAYGGGGATQYPSELMMLKNGTTLGGYYRYTGGAAWTQAGPTWNDASILNVQDIGLYFTSHAAGTLGTATFNYLIIKRYAPQTITASLGSQEALTFKNQGTYVSPSIDTGSATPIWATISYTTSVPPSTSVAVTTRSSADNASWTPWFTESSGNPIQSPPQRYIEYRLNLSTTNTTSSPVLDDISLGYRTSSAGWADMRSSGTTFTSASPYDCGNTTANCTVSLAVTPKALGNYSLRLYGNSTDPLVRPAYSANRTVSIFSQPSFAGFSVSADPAPRNTTQSFTVLLLDDLSQPLAGANVTIVDETGNGTAVTLGSNLTDSSGYATVWTMLGADFTLGSHTVNASYAGNASQFVRPASAVYTYPVTSTPRITNLNATPATVGFGYNVTITANVSDASGLSSVSVNITSNGTTTTHPMTSIGGTGYAYAYNDTWTTGTRSYAITATNVDGQNATSGTKAFSVDVSLSFLIGTEYPTYQSNKIVYVNGTVAPNALDGWLYRVKLSVNPSVNFSNDTFEIPITAGDADFAHMNSDGSDLRVTYYNASSGTETILPLYLDSFDQAAQRASVYVRVPHLTSGKDNTLYLYYGKPGASNVSNGSNVFWFFDDFENFTNWTDHGSGTVTQSSARAHHGTYSAHKNSNNDPNGATEPLPHSIGRGYVLEFWDNRNSAYSGGAYDRLGFIDGSGNGYGWALNHGGTLVVDTRNGYNPTTGGSVPTSTYTNTWTRGRLIIPSTGSIQATYSINGSFAASTAFASPTYSNFTRVYIFGGWDYYVDDLRVYPYVPNPIITYGNEQLLRTGLQNQATAPTKAYLRMLTQHWSGTSWQNLVPPVIDQSLITIPNGSVYNITNAWYTAGGWDTGTEQPGTYRVYGVLEDQNHNTLYASDGTALEASDTFTILSPTLIVTNLTYENELAGLDEYETGDNIAFINVTVGVENNTAYGATIALSMLNSSFKPTLWGPQGAVKSCGTLLVGNTCTRTFDNSTAGYDIPTNVAEGLYAFHWNVTMNASNGPTRTNDTIGFVIHNIPYQTASTLNETRLYRPGSVAYAFNVTNPWSLPLTSVNVTISCPTATGVTCNANGSASQTVSIGSLASGATQTVVFLFNATNSTPSANYNVSANLEYVNPHGDRHVWNALRQQTIEVRYKGILAITDVSHPSSMIRGLDYNLSAFYNNTGDVQANQTTLNYTLPTGWTLLSGTLHRSDAFLAPSQIEYNNITVRASGSAALGPHTVRLDSGANDGRYDFISYSITVYGRTNLTLSAAPSTLNHGDNTTLTATLRYYNGSAVSGATISFYDQTGSSFIANATTDSSGVASVVYTVPPGAALGNRTVNTSFAGSGYALASNSSMNLTVTRPPSILDPKSTPSTVGYGKNVTISANVTDDGVVDTVYASIRYPNGTILNQTMTNVSSNYSLVFNGTWTKGFYNVTIVANDTLGSSARNTTGFTVDAGLGIRISTTNRSYGQNELVRLNASITPWWKSAWPYRRNITITNGLATAVTNTTSIVSIDTGALITAGKLQSACEDMRFAYYNASSASYVEAPHWIEGTCNATGNTSVYVKVPYLPASGSSTIQMYYGNPGAAGDANASRTFVFFDDFENFNGWTDYNGGMLSQSTARVYAGNQSAHKDTNSDPAGALKPLGATVGRNTVVEFWVNRNSGYAGGGADRIGIVDGSGNGYGWIYNHGSGTGYDTRNTYTGSATGYNNTGPNTMDAWVFGRLTIGTTTITADRFINGTLEGQETGTDTAHSSFTEAYIFGGYDYYVDNFRVYRTASGSASVGGEEREGSVVASLDGYTASGSLVITIQSNSTGTWQTVQTVVDDTASSTVRTVPSPALGLSSVFGSWNTTTEPSGSYRVMAELHGPSGVLTDSSGQPIRGYANFTISPAPVQLSVTGIRIYDVTSALPANRHSYSSSLVASGTNTTFNLPVNDIYRFEVDVKNIGSAAWNLTSKSINDTGFTSAWPVNAASDVWFSNSSTILNRRLDTSREGGSYDGTVTWNSSSFATELAPSSTATFFFIVNTSSTTSTPIHFIAEALSRAEDHSRLQVITIDTQPPVLYLLNLSQYNVTPPWIFRGSSFTAYARWNSSISKANVTYQTTSPAATVTVHNTSAQNPHNWTNFTIQTYSTWYLGPHNATITAADLSGNLNDTLPPRTEYVYGKSIIGASSLNASSIGINESVAIQCRVLDTTLSNAPINGYTVTFTNGTGIIGTNTTNSTGWARFVYTDHTAGTEHLNCSIANDLANYYRTGSPNASSMTLSTTEPIPPQYGTISGPASAHKGDTVTLSVRWTDNFQLKRAKLSTNASGSYANVSTTSLSGTAEWANFTYQIPTTMTPGALGWRQWGEDTSSNLNVTPVQTIAVTGWANFKTFSVTPGSISNGSSTTASCVIQDANDTLGIVGYPVIFEWKNQSDVTYKSLGSNTTIAGGVANFTWIPPATGTYDVRCSIANDATLHYDAASPSSATDTLNVVSGADTTPPKLTSWSTYTINATTLYRGQCLLTTGHWDSSINYSYVRYNRTSAGYTQVAGTPPFTGNWTNITLCTNSSWSLGTYSIKLFAADQAGNINDTLTYKTFVVKGRSNVSYVNPTGTLNRTTHTVTCLVRDQDTGTGLSGYPVTFYDSQLGFSIGSASTNSTGYAHVTYDFSSLNVGPDQLSCTIGNSGNYVAQTPKTVSGSVSWLGHLSTTITGPANGTVYLRGQSVPLRSTTVDEFGHTPKSHTGGTATLTAKWINATDGVVTTGTGPNWVIPNNYPLGRANLTLNVSSPYYTNGTSRMYLSVGGGVNVTAIAPVGVVAGTQTIICRAIDSNVGSGVSGYSVNISRGATLIGTFTTNSTGYATTTDDTTALSDGPVTYTCTIADDPAHSLTAVNSTSSTTVTVDNTYPLVAWASNADPSGNYSRSWILINATASDTHLANVTLQWNGTNTTLTGTGGAFWLNETGLVDGTYTARVYANDTAGNTNATSTRTYVIDRTSPTIAIQSPTNTTYNTPDVDVNYTVSDTHLSSCWYTLNGSAPVALSGCANTTLGPLGDGSYDLIVYANDTFGNVNSSAVNFTVQAGVDLIASSIAFIPSSGAVEGQSVTVRVNVTNNGTANANGVRVSLNTSLWNGSWLYQGQQNATINVSANSSKTVDFAWTAQLGVHNFTVFVDSNNSFAEANESNNNLSRNHSISSYQIDYGKVDFSKFLSNAAMQTYKNWSVAKPTGTIYYADADASYFAFNLKPLNGTNDLVEADQALGMTYFNDSISNLWDSNHDGIPDRTATFWIAGVQVSNVPIINSTPGDPFITGIMWDSADGGSQYNGSQDLVFVTRINASTAGAYGTYDYEIRVPSRLKYQISGTNLVDRLTEIE